MVAACGSGGDGGALSTAPPRSSPATTPRPAPAPQAAVRFAVKGDWGWGGPDQAAVTARMCVLARRTPFAFILTTGDNFYRPDGSATPANWDGPERCLIRSGVRWYAAWGNHDAAGDGTVTALRSPRRRYTFADGPLRVIVLDANTPADPAQRRFLAATLARAREPVRVVAFHQPAYTAGVHGPGRDQQRLWAPLFRRGGVAVVLQGHNHAYERIRVDGVVYVTTGGGGAPLYPCVRPVPGLRRCLPVNHFLAVRADATGLDLRAVAESGRVIDRVRIPARRPAMPAGG